MNFAAEIQQLKDMLLAAPKDARDAFLASLSPAEADAIFYNWKFWARPEQLAPPGEWFAWMPLAGRGWGKTRTGAEWIIEEAKQPHTRIALIGKTPKDVRQVMIEGESGILACSSPAFMPEYNASLGTLKWPNGSIALTYSGEVPDQLRGPQFHRAWIDEWAKFRFPVEVWDMLMFGLRLGSSPRVLITTTPRPLPILRQVMADPMTRVTIGSTFDNAANLPAVFLQQIKRKYEGTTLGMQELYARVLDDVEGALWTREMIRHVQRMPLREGSREPAIRKAVLGVDPSVTSKDESDDTGLVLDALGEDGNVYVLGDYTSPGALHLHAPLIVSLWQQGKCDLIVGEVNNGGDLVEHTIRTVRDPETQKEIGRYAPYKSVRATRGKAVRAEPVAMLYQQQRVYHVGQHADLEDQMCTWVPGRGKSPDRVDAHVWAITELAVQPDPELRVRQIA